MKDLDEIRDLSIEIVDKLVESGFVKDCIDTDDETEFEIQDLIVDILCKKFNIQCES